MLVGLVAGWTGSAEAQALAVDGGSESAARFESATTTGELPATSGVVLRAEVTHSLFYDTAAVVGISTPQPFYGFGARFEGGWSGVLSKAQLPGPGSRRGLAGIGQNGSVSNYGVYGEAVAPSDVGSKAYGVWGRAECLGGGVCSKYAVYADGDLVYTGNTYKASDLRFKESLAPLEAALPKLLALEVVSYEHVRGEEAARLNLPEGPQVGFIAQQVAEVLPELVAEVVHPAAEDPRDKSLEVEPIRYLALKPIDLIAYLVRALQEQQAQIAALQAQLLPLQHRLAQRDASARARSPQATSGTGTNRRPPSAVDSYLSLDPF